MKDENYIRKIITRDAFVLVAENLDKNCFSVKIKERSDYLDNLQKVTIFELLRILIQKFAQGMKNQHIFMNFNKFQDKVNLCPFGDAKFNLSDDICEKISKMLSKNATANFKTINFKRIHISEIAYIYELLQSIQIKRNNTKELVFEISQTTRKISGSFYTPLKIVRFIIKNTLKPLIDKHFKDFEIIVQKLNRDSINLNQVQKKLSKFDPLRAILGLKILDPSVGGGVFLIEAAKFLATEIIKGFKKLNKIQKINYKSPVIADFQKIKSEILEQNHQSIKIADFDACLYLVMRNCLFGVDLNPFAVEITKISLELLNRTNLDLNLGLKIKVGNSLNCFENAKIESEKQFVWETEFPEIFFSTQNKGFDAIISNPPYLFGENISATAKQISGNFELAKGQYDEFWLFYELAMTKLLKNHGTHGYIIPDSILIRDYSAKLREQLLRFEIRNIWHVGCAFENLNISTIVLIWQKISSENSNNFVRIADKSGNTWKIKQNLFAKFNNNPFYIYLKNKNAVSVINKLHNCPFRIKDFCDVSRGEDFGIRKFIDVNINSEHLKLIAGRNIKRYFVDLSSCQSISADFKLKKNCNFKPRRILIRKTGKDLIAAFDTSQSALLQSAYCLTLKSEIPEDSQEDIYFLLLAILNSNLLDFWVRLTCSVYKLIFPQLNQSTILNIPLPFDITDFDSAKFANLISDVKKLIVSQKNNGQKSINCNVNKHKLLENAINQEVLTLYTISRLECQKIRMLANIV